MTAEALGNQILSYLDTHWATELDVVDRSVLAAGIALHLAGAGGVSPTAPDERETLSIFDQSVNTQMNVYLVTGRGNPMRALRLATHDALRRYREATTEPQPITDAEG